MRLELPDGRFVWVHVRGASLVGGWLKLGFEAPADVKILRDSSIPILDTDAQEGE